MTQQLIVDSSVKQLIVDQKGQLYTNTGSFPFVDPSTGVRFEPGLQVRVKLSDWMKGQPVIKLVDTV